MFLFHTRSQEIEELMPNKSTLNRRWQSSAPLIDSEASMSDTINEPSQGQPKQPRDHWSRIVIQQLFQGLCLRGSNWSLERMGTRMDRFWNIHAVATIKIILLGCVPGFKPRSWQDFIGSKKIFKNMFLTQDYPKSLKQGPSGTGLSIEISQLSFQLLRDVVV